MLVQPKVAAMQHLVLTRGLPENHELFRNIANAVFSASLWYGKRLSSANVIGHAMLTLMTPGEVWPTHEGGTTIPVELSNVFVSPDLRNQGIATTLVNKCLAHCNRKNWECVLRVTPYGSGHLSNDDMVKWYIRLGFAVYARNNGTYHMVKAPK